MALCMYKKVSGHVESIRSCVAICLQNHFLVNCVNIFLFPVSLLCLFFLSLHRFREWNPEIHEPLKEELLGGKVQRDLFLFTVFLFYQENLFSACSKFYYQWKSLKIPNYFYVMWLFALWKKDCSKYMINQIRNVIFRFKLFSFSTLSSIYVQSNSLIARWCLPRTVFWKTETVRALIHWTGHVMDLQ